MQPKKIPDVVRREIIARAWDGETFAHIARDLGLSRHTVSTIAMREGGLRWSRFFGQVVKVDSRTEQEAPRWPERDDGSRRSSRRG